MKRIIVLLALCHLTFLFSCQHRANRKDASPLNDSTSYSGLTGDSVKLVKTATLDFKVKDIEQSTRAVSGLVKEYGGMVYSQTITSAEEGRKELKLSSDSLLVITAFTPHAAITLRVPSANLEELMFHVADLGYYTAGSQLSIDDRSLAYLQNALKQKVRTNVISRPVSKNDHTSTLTAIAIRDEAIDQQMANKSIDGDVAYSSITLSLSQNASIRKEVIANYMLSDYDLPFGQRLLNATGDGWQYFLEFILALLHLWMFILIGFAAYLSYSYWQHKKNVVVGLKS